MGKFANKLDSGGMVLDLPYATKQAWNGESGLRSYGP